MLGVGLLALPFVFAPGAASVGIRLTNGCGPCLLVATMKRGDERVLFDATAASIPPARSRQRGFRAGDHWTWRLTRHIGSGSVASLALRLGSPGRPGKTLFTLCAPCRAKAGGRTSLGSDLARVLNRGVTCRHDCPAAESWPLGAYVLVKLDASASALTGQLRFCAANQYRDRNSCRPAGY